MTNTRLLEDSYEDELQTLNFKLGGNDSNEEIYLSFNDRIKRFMKSNIPGYMDEAADEVDNDTPRPENATETPISEINITDYIKSIKNSSSSKLPDKPIQNYIKKKKS